MQQISKAIDRVENVTLVWLILGLAIISFIQVVTRYVFSYSFVWFEELARYLTVLITFLGAGIGVKSCSHFTMDLMVTHLKHPWDKFLRLLIALISGLFCVLVSFYSWKIIFRMHGFGATSPALGIPMYVAYLPIPIFSMVMAFRFCKVMILQIKGDRNQPGPDRGEDS
ncbi:MAG: TRAP transporter small permease [Pseudomonadota bacterium]